MALKRKKNPKRNFTSKNLYIYLLSEFICQTKLTHRSFEERQYCGKFAAILPCVSCLYGKTIATYYENVHRWQHLRNIIFYSKIKNWQR
jgi:hypothetical protein